MYVNKVNIPGQVPYISGPRNAFTEVFDRMLVYNFFDRMLVYNSMNLVILDLNIAFGY